MIEGLAHGDPGIYVTLVIALAVVSMMGLVVRSIIRGELIPKATVEREAAERNERIDTQAAERNARIDAQAAALESAAALIAEQSHTIREQADAISDFGEAQRLNVRVAQALHDQVTANAAGGE